MKSPVRFAAMFVIFAFSALAQQKSPETVPEMSVCPMHAQNPSSQDQNHQGVVQRGDEVMGFSHEKTTHHFRLYPDGGAIEAEANESKDTASRNQIRSHFEHIVTMFAAGDFSAPMLIHAQHPPGSEVMKRLRNVIDYKVESTEKGARIHIRTKDSQALRAIHEFLRFQISDHQTGDSLEVTKVP
jgi:tRNA threonylcarbamoyladenosine modification (KEOPS) complex  Pcc1 subunit